MAKGALSTFDSSTSSKRNILKIVTKTQHPGRVGEEGTCFTEPDDHVGNDAVPFPITPGESGICPGHLEFGAQNSLGSDCIFAHRFFKDQRFYTRKKCCTEVPSC